LQAFDGSAIPREIDPAPDSLNLVFCQFQAVFFCGGASDLTAEMIAAVRSGLSHGQ